MPVEPRTQSFRRRCKLQDTHGGCFQDGCLLHRQYTARANASWDMEAANTGAKVGTVDRAMLYSSENANMEEACEEVTSDT